MIEKPDIQCSPFFTIIIPIFNREKELLQTLESVSSQTFTDYEVILVDDCSNDKSFEVASNFQMPNKIVLRNEVNNERCITRNKGIAAAKGRYVCFLDSDDRFLPQHLQTFYNAITQKNFPVAMFFTNSFLENENGSTWEKKVPLLKSQNIFAYLLQYTPNPARVCVERSILNELDFDKNIPGIEDLDLWLHIALKYSVVHIPEFTNIYFVHSGSYTQGDLKRHEKELRFFKYVFAKPEFKCTLPGKSKRRLLSNAHYHLAVAADSKRQIRSFYQHAFKAFFLYPQGYNDKINKSLFVMVLYNLPLFGNIVKFVYRKGKR